MDIDNISPGTLIHVGNDKEEWISILIYYIIALVVFLVYAKETFSLGAAILYSIFWPFGIIYSFIT